MAIVVALASGEAASASVCASINAGESGNPRLRGDLIIAIVAESVHACTSTPHLTCARGLGIINAFSSDVAGEIFGFDTEDQSDHDM